jgi:hypothetical protein
VQFEDKTCDHVLDVCGVHTVSQVLDQHLSSPEEEEEEMVEDKLTFLDAQK